MLVGESVLPFRHGSRCRPAAYLNCLSKGRPAACPIWVNRPDRAGQRTVKGDPACTMALDPLLKLAKRGKCTILPAWSRVVEFYGGIRRLSVALTACL